MGVRAETQLRTSFNTRHETHEKSATKQAHRWRGSLLQNDGDIESSVSLLHIEAMQSEAFPVPVFGAVNPAVEYTPRPAAYVVITDQQGRVAAVKGKYHYFLPGGGSLPDETPAETVQREVREELARELGNLHEIGQAVQYFAADETHYRMEAVFFAAEFASAAHGSGEHELAWLDAAQAATGFFHQCHVWAIGQL